MNFSTLNLLPSSLIHPFRVSARLEKSGDSRFDTAVFIPFLDDAWREKAMELILEKAREARATLVIATTGTVPGAEYFRQVRLLKGKVISDGVNNH